MSKTIKKCFDEKLTFVNLLAAHERASKNKRNKIEIILFEMDLETNIIKIMDEIRSGTYKFGKYREFIVYEPKERIIKSLPYRDRVVHQWYVEEFIKPYFFPRFINDTYVCLDSRGSHIAVKKLQHDMQIMKRIYKEYYVLKCDIKKYFYNIDKNILLKILNKKISDKKLLEFSKVVLNDGVDIGIPIGNYTSQYFANIYLNELDHFVKEKLRVRFYIRYMDDFVLLLKDKNEAKKVLKEITTFIENELHLQLNSKSKYFPSRYGVDFCGYQIYETHMLLRKRYKKKLKNNILIWDKLKKENKFYDKKFISSWNSSLAHASHANSYNFIKKCKVKVDKILNS